MLRTGALAVVLGTQQLKWVILGFLESGKNAVIAAAQIGGSLVMAMVRYAASGWQVVGSLVAQGAAWVVTRVQALAANAVLIAQQVVMVAGTVATWAATAATTAFGMAMTVLTGPIGLVCLAIVALIAVGILVWKHWDRIKAFLLVCWDGIKTGVTIAFNAVVGFLKRWGLTILAVVAGPVGWVTLLIVKNWMAISGFLTSIWQGIITGARVLWQGVVAGVQWLWQAMVTVGRAYIGIYITTFRLLWQATIAVWNGITAAVQGAWQGILQVGQWAWNLLTSGWNNLQAVALQVWQGIQSAASACWQGLVLLGQMLWTGITAPFLWIASVAQIVWTGITTAAGNAWNSLHGMVNAALGWITSPFQRLATWGASAWTTITSAASNAFSTISNLLTNLASTALESGRRLMTTIADGIRSAVSAPYEALKAGLAKARKLLPFSDAQEGPLSALTRSGFSLLETISSGMRQASTLPAEALHGAFTAMSALPAITVPLQPVLASAVPFSSLHTMGSTPARSGTISTAGSGASAIPIEQAQLLAQTRTMLPSPASSTVNTSPASTDLQALLERLDALGNRPIEVTVISKLDGREIARAVYRDLREQKIRNYETLG